MGAGSWGESAETFPGPEGEAPGNGKCEPTALSGLEAAVSTPHSLQPLPLPEEAGVSTQACVLFFLFSLCSLAFNRDPWEMLLRWDQEGTVLVQEGGKLHPFTPFPHQDHP